MAGAAFVIVAHTTAAANKGNKKQPRERRCLFIEAEKAHNAPCAFCHRAHAARSCYFARVHLFSLYIFALSRRANGRTALLLLLCVTQQTFIVTLLAKNGLQHEIHTELDEQNAL